MSTNIHVFEQENNMKCRIELIINTQLSYCITHVYLQDKLRFAVLSSIPKFFNDGVLFVYSSVAAVDGG